jgi:type IV pilus assembly protein PilC
VDGRDADMTKMLLRLCVYIYKGLTLISKYTSRGIKVILRLFIKENISDLSKKTKDIISKEKKKQERIALIEEQRLKRETLKQEKINKKKQLELDKKNARLARIEEKKRKKLEKKERRAMERKNRLERRKKTVQVKPKKIDERKKLKEEARLAKLETKAKAKLAKEKREEEVLKKSLESTKKRNKQAFKSDSVTINKLTFSDKLNNFTKNIRSIPSKIEKSLRDKWNNTSFAKNRRNKLDMNRKALLVEFNGKEAERSEVKIMYEYIVKDQDGKIIKGHADGYSKVEIHSYLLSEGYEVYSIRTNKWIQILYGSTGTNKVKIKTKDLIFFVTQLSTYLKSGITLIESLKILSRQYKKKSYKKIFKMIIYDLSMGENLSTAMENRGVAFPNLLITMVKSAEMTGELPEVLDDMADYYTETEKTRKQMITAMMYPSIVFVFAISVLTFIMLYVIPKFVDIYASMDGVQIPALTQFIINMSSFMKKNIILIGLAVLLLILLFRFLYKKNKTFRTFIQWSLMHLPVVSNIIIYKEVTMFTKTFSSLLAHNVYITDSMEILSKVTQNEIYRSLIFNTVTNLARGERLSAEFEGHWAFPIPAYEMIVTGERTGQLPEMMAKVSAYYQELHQNAVTRIKTFIEPALIIFLTAMVGIIVLSIVLPMFNMYQSIQQTGV